MSLFSVGFIIFFWLLVIRMSYYLTIIFFFKGNHHMQVILMLSYLLLLFNHFKHLFDGWMSHFLRLSKFFYHLFHTGVWIEVRILFSYVLMIFGLMLVLIAWQKLLQVKTTRQVSGKEIIEDGIYRYTRHPQYLALIFMLISLWVYLSDSTTFYAGMIFIFMILLIIKDEESMLVMRFNEEYKKYQMKTKKLIPFIY